MLNKLKPKSEFSRNVLTLMTGTTIAQAIPIAISPILTRIYTPEDFGMFALYASIVSLLAIIINGKYDMAIVLPKEEKEAFNIFILSLLITFFITFFIAFFIFLFFENILLWLNNKEIGLFLYFIPISLFLMGIYQSLYYWWTRKKKFKHISESQIYQSLIIGSVQISSGYLQSIGGLIYGNIVGRFIAVFILLKYFFKENLLNRKDIQKKVLLEQMLRYKEFPLISTFHSLSEISRISGTVILISFFFGGTILGFYALALRILQVPLGIVGSSLGQVLYQKFNTLYTDRQLLYPYIKMIVLKLLLIAIPIFSILYMILPDLFKFVFGNEWYQAGEYSRLLIPYLFMNFIVAPISHLIMILEKQRTFFYIGFVINLVILLMVFAGGKFSFSLNEILLSTSIVMALYLCVVLYMLLEYSKEIRFDKNAI
ncbi:MAG: oligosaccharide flippase family protein [Sulfurovum sp.]|nr:oligosaccharide flippase family protein [Sulfurovum sp.]